VELVGPKVAGKIAVGTSQAGPVFTFAAAFDDGLGPGGQPGRPLLGPPSGG
jgi:hypothetical protein